MHDIDAHIARITGQSNYMESLKKVTGDIMSINKEKYQTELKKISAYEFVINENFKKITSKTNVSLAIMQEFIKQSQAVDIKNSVYVWKIRKSKKKPQEPKEKLMKTPVDLIKTEWFKTIKTIEKGVHKFNIELGKSVPQNENLEYKHVEKAFADDPTFVELFTIFDVKITSKDLFTWFTQIHEACKNIIDILLSPMYDVLKTINSNWKVIEKIFDNKIIDKLNQNEVNFKPEDIVTMLHKFVIAKYRATITGNNKHYVRLFLDTVGNENVSNMDGARFLEIMESIDLEKLNKRDKVYKFAVGAKTLLEDMIKNNSDDINPELIAKFENIFNEKDEEEVTNNETPEETQDRIEREQTTEYADILN
jgi:hypothetical protein